MATYASNQLPKNIPSFPVALVPITPKEANKLRDLAIYLLDDTILDESDQVVISNPQGQWLLSPFLIEDNEGNFTRKPYPEIYGNKLYC